MAPRSPRHAALLVLAHKGAQRPHALPGTTITAPSGAFNRWIQGRFPCRGTAPDTAGCRSPSGMVVLPRGRVRRLASKPLGGLGGLFVAEGAVRPLPDHLTVGLGELSGGVQVVTVHGMHRPIDDGAQARSP